MNQPPICDMTLLWRVRADLVMKRQSRLEVVGSSTEPIAKIGLAQPGHARVRSTALVNTSTPLVEGTFLVLVGLGVHACARARHRHCSRGTSRGSETVVRVM